MGLYKGRICIWQVLLCKMRYDTTMDVGYQSLGQLCDCCSLLTGMILEIKVLIIDHA